MKYENNSRLRLSIGRLKYFLTILYCWYLDDKNPIKLYQEVKQIERKKGSNFSIMCTTEHGSYYYSKFKWFKENGVLPNTSNIVRHSTSIKLDFSSLKVEDNGLYKCNINNDGHLKEERFQLIVFGKSFSSSW